jgi:hypothetical protein
MSTKLAKKIERLFKEIRDTMISIDRRLEKLEVQTSTIDSTQATPGTLRTLPEHLRKTMEAVAFFGEATAQQVSDKTGRSRAAESDYLNQLTGRGFLKKERKGREIMFQVYTLHTFCSKCGNRILITAKFCNQCGNNLMPLTPTLTNKKSTNKA